MKHTVYTRHTYPPGDERHRPRLELAAQTSIPSFLSARAWANHDVRWVWWAYPQHRAAIIDTIRDRGYLGELHVLPGDTVLEDDNIQTTLDSDDILGTHLLDRVQYLFANDDGPGHPQLVTYQPVKLELETGHVYRHRMEYGPSCPSMFYSILHPTPEVRVYKLTHTRMAELCPARLDPFPGAATAVIHGANHLMKIHDDEERLS